MNDIIERLGIGNVGAISDPVGLAMACRLIEGSRGLITVGAHALAAFLLDPDDEKRLAQAMLVKLAGADTLRRLLADALSLDGETAEQVGRCTDGAVLPDMFERIWVGAADAEAASIGEAMADPLCAVRGRMGEATSGPLFIAMEDAATPNEFIVSGQGVAMKFNAPLARSMRDALTAGLVQIGGRG